MPGSLNQEQIIQYREQGYLSGIRVLSEQQAIEHRSRFEALEAKLENLSLPKSPSSYSVSYTHLTLPTTSRV